MTRLIRTLATAALATAALAATPARADHDRDCDHRAPPAPRVTYAPAPARVVVVPADHRRNELRHEWRELERARDRFYATWNGNRWEQRRFERWYGARRAELEREWTRVADRRWDRIDRDRDGIPDRYEHR